ncbi:MAG: hypothetical protein IPN89_11940 [Saprospiraceae bacterium]|nr:hypothetical protein [Saprospiraceae bacterium]
MLLLKPIRNPAAFLPHNTGTKVASGSDICARSASLSTYACAFQAFHLACNQTPYAGTAPVSVAE